MKYRQKWPSFTQLLHPAWLEIVSSFLVQDISRLPLVTVEILLLHLHDNPVVILVVILVILARPGDLGLRSPGDRLHGTLGGQLRQHQFPGQLLGGAGGPPPKPGGDGASLA